MVNDGLLLHQRTGRLQHEPSSSTWLARASTATTTGYLVDLRHARATFASTCWATWAYRPTAPSTCTGQQETYLTPAAQDFPSAYAIEGRRTPTSSPAWSPATTRTVGQDGYLRLHQGDCRPLPTCTDQWPMANSLIQTAFPQHRKTCADRRRSAFIRRRYSVSIHTGAIGDDNRSILHHTRTSNLAAGISTVSPLEGNAAIPPN
ncbi:hypothetical protein AB7B99_28500 [Klebsiella pneumoniae]